MRPHACWAKSLELTRNMYLGYIEFRGFYSYHIGASGAGAATGARGGEERRGDHRASWQDSGLPDFAGPDGSNHRDLEIMGNPHAMEAIRAYEAGEARFRDVSCLDGDD